MKTGITRKLFFRSALAAAILMTLHVAPSWAQAPYASPKDAVAALAVALQAQDTSAVMSIMGPDAGDILDSGDPVADENARERFLKLYEEKNAIILDRDGERASLEVGKDNWPFPVPLIKTGATWSFDTAEGRTEILARRIGRNELSVIEVCKQYVQAQDEYADLQKKQFGHYVYAQKVMSSEGRKDGLYWPDQEGQPESPLGDMVAEASAEGYKGGGAPYYGYYYKILTQQGSAAKGGELDYVVDGKMIGGFALVAWPAEYGNSGVMSFMVSHDGVIYQRDLGEGTEKLAKAITKFDPGEGWVATNGNQ